MKRIFIDTNILLDFLARRGDFFIPAWNVISRRSISTCWRSTKSLLKNYQSLPTRFSH